MFACSIAGQTAMNGPLEVNWIYDENRPFEVRLQSVTGSDIVVSRDTLSEAYSNGGQTSGIGWVQFMNTGKLLYTNMRTAMGGLLSVVFPADEVETFLKRTYEVVPWGKESLDIDTMLDDFYNDKI